METIKKWIDNPMDRKQEQTMDKQAQENQKEGIRNDQEAQNDGHAEERSDREWAQQLASQAARWMLSSHLASKSLRKSMTNEWHIFCRKCVMEFVERVG